MSSTVPTLPDERVDPVLGPITRLVVSPRVDGEPEALRAVTAHTAALGEVLPWRPDPQGSGCTFDLAQSRECALGEAVERYAGNFPHPPVATGPAASLSTRGERVLDPACLLAIDDAQQRASARLLPWDEHRELDWLQGSDVVTGEPVLVPSEAVLLHRDPARPYSLVPRMGGIAAGRSVQHAVGSGLLELLERDATARWWLLGGPCTELGAAALEALPLDGMSPALHVRLFLLPTAAPGVRTACAVMRDDELDVSVAGFAARTSVGAALAKAVGECFQLRRICRALLDPRSWAWRAGRDGRPATFPLAAYRADRRYLDDLRPEVMTQLVHNLQHALDPRSREAFESHLEATVAERWDRPRIDLGPGPAFRPVGDEGLADRGLGTLVWTDLTTPDVELLGYTVVRVTAPDLLINAPEAWLPWRDVRRLFGVGPHDVPPMPHA